MIEQPARGCNDHLRGLGKSPDLLPEGHPAENGHALDLQVPPVGAGGLRDLVRQFAGRGQHQDAGTAFIAAACACQPLECGQDKSRRLAGTGLGGGNDVASGERLGNGLNLDRSGMMMVALGQSLENG